MNSQSCEEIHFISKETKYYSKFVSKEQLYDIQNHDTYVEICLYKEIVCYYCLSIVSGNDICPRCNGDLQEGWLLVGINQSVKIYTIF